MSSIRPADATHTDSVGNYYKPNEWEELYWMRWDGIKKWVSTGTVPAGSLTPLPSVQVVELEKFDAPMAPTLPENYVPPAPPVQVTISSEVGRMPQYAPMKPSTADNWGTCGQLPTMPEPVGVGFAHYFTEYQFVGSRITCSPPPLDTDQDVLVMVHKSNRKVMEDKMFLAGFLREGSNPAEMDLNVGKDNVFHSYRKGDMNYIVTTDEAFYQRFSTATELARKYNLMEKTDRIQLFQAVLYGKWWA